MDCPTCHGTGELESKNCNDEKHSKEEQRAGMFQDRASWPYTCPVCGGSGYLEETM